MAILNDVLSFQSILQTDRIIEEGFILFTFSMAIALGLKLGKSLGLADELNIKLDAKVTERTKELNAALLSVDLALNESEKLNQFTKKINESTDLDKILDSIFNYIQENYGLDGCMLHLLDRKTKTMKFFKVSARDFHTQEQFEFAKSISFPMNVHGGMIRDIIKKKRAVYLPRFPELNQPDDPIVRLQQKIKFQSGMIVPLIVQDDAIGVILFSNFTKRMNLSRTQRNSIKRFCEQIAGAVYSTTILNQVQEERARSDKLLLNILPSSVANELKESGQVTPLNYESVTVLFTDFVGFTGIAEKLAATELIHELDGCFTQFDEETARNKLEKLKTIGDAYMCAGGLPNINSTHAVDACLAALEFQNFMLQMSKLKGELNLPYWTLRIGIHTGPVTAGVVGKNKFAYDIWGDTVNTASRMESSGVAGEVNISGHTYELVKDFFKCENRGKVEAKGKGMIDMYFVKGIKPGLTKKDNPGLPNSEFNRMYQNLSL